MNLWNETKSIPISRQMVLEAYQKVRSNKGSAGIDAVSMQEFDANRRKHLYKLWNRKGGLISPLLANLFLHYAFDKWLENREKYPSHVMPMM